MQGSGHAPLPWRAAERSTVAASVMKRRQRIDRLTRTCRAAGGGTGGEEQPRAARGLRARGSAGTRPGQAGRAGSGAGASGARRRRTIGGGTRPPRPGTGGRRRPRTHLPAVARVVRRGSARGRGAACLRSGGEARRWEAVLVGREVPVDRPRNSTACGGAGEAARRQNGWHDQAERWARRAMRVVVLWLGGVDERERERQRARGARDRRKQNICASRGRAHATVRFDNRWLEKG